MSMMHVAMNVWKIFQCSLAVNLIITILSRIRDEFLFSCLIKAICQVNVIIAGPILEGINGQRNQILGGCIFLALLCLLLGYRQAALLLANLAFAIFTFASRQSRVDRSIVPVQSSTNPQDNEDSGEWKVILIRAELIKDEPWSGE